MTALPVAHTYMYLSCISQQSITCTPSKNLSRATFGLLSMSEGNTVSYLLLADRFEADCFLLFFSTLMFVPAFGVFGCLTRLFLGGLLGSPLDFFSTFCFLVFELASTLSPVSLLSCSCTEISCNKKQNTNSHFIMVGLDAYVVIGLTKNKPEFFLSSPGKTSAQSIVAATLCPVMLAVHVVWCVNTTNVSEDFQKNFFVGPCTVAGHILYLTSPGLGLEFG